MAEIQSFHRLRDLPPELRLKIYSINNDLSLTHDLNRHIPHLLIALAPDKVLYDEARDHYKKHNQSVSYASQKKFKHAPMSDIMKIRTLRLVWPTIPTDSNGNMIPLPPFTEWRTVSSGAEWEPYPHEVELLPEHNYKFELRGNKVTLMNNIEKIIAVVEEGSFASSEVFMAVELLCIASKRGVKCIELREEIPPPPRSAFTTPDGGMFKEFCNFPGTLVDQGKLGGDRVWRWEAGNGQSFRKRGPIKC